MPTGFIADVASFVEPLIMEGPLPGENVTVSDDTLLLLGHSQATTVSDVRPAARTELVEYDGTVVPRTTQLYILRDGKHIPVRDQDPENQAAVRDQIRSARPSTNYPPDSAGPPGRSASDMQLEANRAVIRELGFDPTTPPGLGELLGHAPPYTGSQHGQTQLLNGAGSGGRAGSQEVGPGYHLQNATAMMKKSSNRSQPQINSDQTPAPSFCSSSSMVTPRLPDTPVTPGPRISKATNSDSTSLDPVSSSSRVKKQSSRKTRASASINMDMSKVILEHRDQQSNACQGINHVFGPTQRKRGKLDEAGRKDLAIARKKGACVSCKHLKRKCIPGDSLYSPCKACVHSWHSSILRRPCKVPVKLDHLKLCRSGPPDDNSLHPLKFQHLWDVSRLPQVPDFCVVELTQDMGPTLRLTLSTFTDFPQDKTAYEWDTPDGPRKMNMPRYCIANKEEAIVRVREYAKRSMGAYLHKLLPHNNPQVCLIFRRAAELQNPLTLTALRIWCTTRLLERTWRFSGGETLDVSQIDDPSNPWNGMVPVTPIMDQQLDQIVINHILKHQQELLLSRLETVINDDCEKRERWIEVFLAIFILLHNIAVQLKEEHAFAKRYGMSGRYGPYGKYKDAEALFHVARALLAYFHFNYRGVLAFSLQTIPESIARCPMQSKFVTLLRDQIPRIKSELYALLQGNNYEADMYWCHQLFVDDWQAGTGQIKELSDDLSQMSIDTA